LARRADAPRAVSGRTVFRIRKSVVRRDNRAAMRIRHAAPQRERLG
jgi:hypothetical protein